MRAAIAAAVACFIITGLSAAQESSAAIKQYELNIPRQSLDAALKQFAEQTGLQVARFSDTIDGSLEVGPLTGNLSAEQALVSLLSPKGLAFKMVNDRTVAVINPVAPRVPASTTTTEASEPPTASGTAAQSRSLWERFRLAQMHQEKTAGDTAVANEDGSTSERKSDRVMQEIVVTAQRREERLQEVPISISVLTGEYLDSSTSSGVLEELTKIPAVSLMPQPEGRSIIVIRGAAPQGGVSPVGYYFDMVPISFLSLALAPDTDVYDMQRVEVLKGPQGTGYGIGSSTGVVRVLTNDPDPSKLESKGRVSVSSTQGGGTNYRGDAAVNVPIIDGRLAIRGVVGLENWGGWIDRLNKKDANEGDATDVRLKIGGELAEGFSAVAGVWHSKRNGGPAAADDNGNRNVFYDEETNATQDVYSLQLKKDFNAFSLVSSTSYIDLHAGYFKRSIFTTIGNALENAWDARAFSGEVNLSSKGDGPWKWTAGVIYRSLDDRNRSRLAPLAVINTTGWNPDDVSGGDSYAGFGELSYSFSQFEVLAGLRYTKEDRDGHSGLPGAAPIPEASFDKVTPRLVLSWKPNRNSMTYLSYAEGFRSGLLQPAAATAAGFGPVESDLLRNYELGNKATILDGRLSWEASVYYMDWQDLQQALSLPVFVSGQILFVNGVTNAGSASGFGGEVGVTLRPTEGFQIGGSYSQNDLEFDTDVSSSGIVLFSTGDRLATSPKSTYGLFADYTAPVGSDLEFRVGASLSHASSQIQRLLFGGVTDINNDPVTIAGLNVGIGRNDGSRKVSLFVDNLTDEDAATGNNYSATTPVLIGNPDEGLRVRPRTVGLQFEVKF
jgi:iron complex outermembrane recepter protein